MGESIIVHCRALDMDWRDNVVKYYGKTSKVRGSNKNM